MTIHQIQQEVDQWIKSYGVRYFNEMTNTLLLSEEVGEFSRLIARKYGEQSFKISPSEEELKQSIADEMADILFVLVCLANQMDVDLEKTILKNLEKKTKRDKDRHKNNSKLSN